MRFLSLLGKLSRHYCAIQPVNAISFQRRAGVGDWGLLVGIYPPPPSRYDNESCKSRHFLEKLESVKSLYSRLNAPSSYVHMQGFMRGGGGGGG